MIKHSIRILFIFLMVFTFSLTHAGCIKAQETGTKAQQVSPKASGDLSAELEEEAEVLEEDLDKISLQFEKIVDIIVEKYKTLMPKIKAAAANIQKKIEELMESFQEDEGPTQ